MAPRQPGLPRAVLRWLQSLDLPACPRHCRRDFSNGYLVVEILARYFPLEIRSRACGTGSSLPAKLSNWARLRRFFAKHNLSVAQELIEGTIHCKPGAAERLVQDIYSMLTNRWTRGWDSHIFPQLQLRISEQQLKTASSRPALVVFVSLASMWLGSTVRTFRCDALG